jgi:hypothetical protein
MIGIQLGAQLARLGNRVFRFSRHLGQRHDRFWALLGCRSRGSRRRRNDRVRLHGEREDRRQKKTMRERALAERKIAREAIQKEHGPWRHPTNRWVLALSLAWRTHWPSSCIGEPVFVAVVFFASAELTDGGSIQKKEAAIVAAIKTMRHFMACPSRSQHDALRRKNM